MMYDEARGGGSCIPYEAQKDSVFIHSQYYLLFRIYLWFLPAQ